MERYQCDVFIASNDNNNSQGLPTAEIESLLKSLLKSLCDASMSPGKFVHKRTKLIVRRSINFDNHFCYKFVRSGFIYLFLSGDVCRFCKQIWNFRTSRQTLDKKGSGVGHL